MIESMNGYVLLKRQKQESSHSLPSGLLRVDLNAQAENPLVKGENDNGVYCYLASDAYQVTSEGVQYDLVHEANIIAREV